MSNYPAISSRTIEKRIRNDIKGCCQRLNEPCVTSIATSLSKNLTYFFNEYNTLNIFPNLKRAIYKDLRKKGRTC
jgi:hypothetical protein